MKTFDFYMENISADDLDFGTNDIKVVTSDNRQHNLRIIKNSSNITIEVGISCVTYETEGFVLTERMFNNLPQIAKCVDYLAENARDHVGCRLNIIYK